MPDYAQTSRNGIEHWLPITGYPDYEISNLGRVCNVSGKILSDDRCAASSKKRYLKVRLYKDKVGANFNVHTLMLLTFVGPPPERLSVARHLDDNELNCRLYNLAWGTRQDNADDMRRNGTGKPCMGESNGQSTLTKSDVALIRQLYESGEFTQRRLAARFGVTQSHISRILRNVNWGNVSCR